MTKRWLRAGALWLALGGLGVAQASDRMCASDSERARMGHFADRLARAESVERAQEIALGKTAVAHHAIDQAARILPGEGAEIAEANARLAALEAGILAATTPAEVADQFHRLDAVGGKCDYNTVEIVVIVIGFVFGILPGILFLLLFC